mgnify:FL=1|jgi:hypothetical protein
MDEPNLELAPVAPGQEELTIKQLQYAHGLATGLDYNVAWRRAGLGPYTKKKATTLAKHPEVAMVIKDVVESSNRANVMALQEKRAYLASIVRSVEGELSEKSIHAKVIRKVANGEESFEIRGIDKLKALELDSKLAGDFDRVEEAGGGVLAEFIARIRQT